LNSKKKDKIHLNKGKSKPACALSTPVLFLIFNRPETTFQVFKAIQKVKPLRLLIAADGPRTDRPEDTDLCANARKIATAVDWECEVKTLFRERNLGCQRAVSSAIDWFFENVDEGIILEDDCLPVPTFFRYCQELLYYYRHDHRIGMISGANFQFGNRHNDDSYYFSKYFHIWGWASWRDRWAGSYDVNMTKWPRIRDEGWLADMVGEPSEASYWQPIFESVYHGEIDTWDYQWLFTNWVEGRLSITSAVNLISNIGFGDNASHTKWRSIFSGMKTDDISFPLKHPLYMVRNALADFYTAKIMFYRPLWKRIAMNVRNFFVKKKYG